MASAVEFGIKINIDGNKDAVDGMEQVKEATTRVGVAAEETSQKIVTAQQAAGAGVDQVIGGQMRYGEAIVSTGSAAQNVGQKIAAANRDIGSSTAQLAVGQDQVAQATTRAGAVAQDVGQKIAASQKAAGDATARLTIGQQLFIEKLQQQAAAAGLTRTQLLQLQAAQMGLSGVSAGYIAQIESATASHHKFNLASAGTTRELVVMGREVMTGNFDQLGSSMMVLANRTGLAQLAFTGMGAAVLGTLAIAATIGYVFYEGAQQSQKLANSLKITGDFAGITEGQFNAMARTIADSSRGSIGEARSALQTLVSSGQFTGEALTAVGAAALTMSRLTGQSSEDVAKDFAKMADGVVKWVDEHDKQYHAISTAQYQHIRTLEEEGKTQEAMALTGKLVDDALRKNTENLGFIRSALKTAKSAWDEFWDSALDAGRAQTPEQKIASVTAEIEMVNSGRTSMSRDEIKAWGKQKLAELAGYEKEKADAIAKAKQDAVDKKEAEDGKQAVREIAAMHQRYETSKQAEIREIKQYQDDIVKIMKAGGEIDSDELQAQTIAAIHARYANKQKADDPRAAALANALRAGQDEINAEKAKYTALEQLADLYHKYGATSDADYYAQKKGYTLAIEEAEIAGYDKQLASLQAFHAKTEKERTANAGKIAETQAKKLAAEGNYSATVQKYYVEEMLQSGVAQKQADDAMEKHLLKLTEEANKAEAANLVHGKSKSVLDLETIATNNNAIAKQRARIAQMGLVDGQEAEIVHAQKVITNLEAQNVQLGRTAAAMDVAAQIKIDDQQWVNAVASAKTFETEASTSFGNVGTAIGKMTVALTDFGAAQDKIDKQRALAMSATTDDAKKQQIADKAKLDSAQLQVKSYGDIAHAASGLFDQHSKGYAAMHAIEQAFRITEIAMSAEATIAKLLGITTVTAAKQVANTVEVAGVQLTLAPVISAEGAKQSAYGVTALAAALAAPFPANIPAFAMVGAMLASIGVLIGGTGGGSAPDTAKARQDAQGTGTVLGDSTAKSDSIRHSIEEMQKNSDLLVPINQGMLNSLKSIEASMTGLTNLVVRTTGLTDGANMGIKTGTIATGGPAALAGSAQVGSMIGGALAGPLGVWIGGAIGGAVSKLWGKTTQNIVDSGLQYGGSVRGLQQGQGFDQYASVDTTTSSWLGLRKSTDNSVKTQGLSDELSQQFGLIFTNLDKSLQAASVALGGSAADVSKVLDGLTLESTKVSLKGLTGTALTDALNSVISKSTDEIAQAAFPQLDQFREVGEGYSETVMRIAGDYAKLDSILAASGTTFGATGMASIAAREHLIELAGGIDKLASQSTSFNENFLSKAEQLAPVQKYVTDQLAAMGRAGITTRDQLKDAVLGLANSGALATEAGAKEYAQLLALSDAFAKTHAATVDLTKSEQEIADERKSLMDQYDQIALTSTQALEKQRSALDASNQALFDQIQVAQASKDMLDKAAAEAKAAADQHKSLQDQLDQATMTSTQLLAKQRDAVYAGNKALFDQIQAEAAAKAARDAATSDLGNIVNSRNGIADDMFNAMLGGKDLQGKIAALQSAEDAMWAMVGPDAGSLATLEKIKALDSQRLGFEAQLQDQTMADHKTQYDTRKQQLNDELGAMQKMRDFAGQMHDFAVSLKMGSLSALDPKAQLDTAQAAYQSMLLKAQQGDASAMSGLQGAAQDYLQQDKNYNGSNGAYAATFSGVVSALEQFGATAPTDAQLAAQQQQISIIESTSSTLSTTVRDTSSQQIDVLKRIDAALAKAQEASEAQLSQAGATNAELIKQVQTLNVKLAEIESKLALAAAA